MKIKTTLLALAAAGLAATPIAAQAVEADRASAPVDGEAQLGGFGDYSAILIVALILGIGLFAHLITDNEPNRPVSP